MFLAGLGRLPATLQRRRHLVQIRHRDELPVMRCGRERLQQCRTGSLAEGDDVQVDVGSRDGLRGRQRVVRVAVVLSVAQQPDAATRTTRTLAAHFQREPQRRRDVRPATAEARGQRGDACGEFVAPRFSREADVEGAAVKPNHTDEICPGSRAGCGLRTECPVRG